MEILFDPFVKNLQKIFSGQKNFKNSEDSNYSASIFIPIFLKNSQPHLLFTKRTFTVSRHKGEISFPGGMKDESDITLLDCALRETEEEVSIKRDDITVLGFLEPITTHYNLTIVPFVGYFPYPYRFKTSIEEVQYLIEVPIYSLMEKNNYYNISNLFWMEKKHTINFYYYGEHVIWGISAHILTNFLSILRSI